MKEREEGGTEAVGRKEGIELTLSISSRREGLHFFSFT